MDVLEINNDNVVLIDNRIRINGFISKDRCPNCDNLQIYSDEYDALFCAFCNVWLEPKCSKPNCEQCAKRAEKPLAL